MAYLALYRKYRPRKFDEVIGQDYVTQILKNQILTDRIGHAYLFTGIRGTGKTSIAKIFARAVNCTDTSDGNPCGKCSTCENIEQAGVMDIIEIDAASNRGVDEIRDIRDKVIYPPKIGRYKVYIIDEVHMLTKEAFNALLKTLEEPPAHVIFILATTEPNKLPATILSRCQRFDIRPISREMIAGQIEKILRELEIRMEPEAVKLIAARGDHSMRDALSILDQAIDIRNGNETITEKKVLEFLGMTGEDQLIKLIKAVNTSEAGKVIKTINEIKANGIDCLQLINQIIDLLRTMIIVKTVGSGAAEILEKNETEIQTLKSVTDEIPISKLYQMVDGLIEDRQKMRYNDLSSIVLEMALLKLCQNMEEKENKAEEANEKKKRLQTVVQEKPVTEGKKHSDKIETKFESRQSPWEALPAGWENSIPEPPEETGSFQDEGLSELKTNTDKKKQKGYFGNKEVQRTQVDLKADKKGIIEDSDYEETKKEEKHTEKVRTEANENDLNTGHNGEKPDADLIESIEMAIDQWKASQDFFTQQVVTYGHLKHPGQNHYEMVFQAPEHNMFAGMFNGRIQNQVREIIEKTVGNPIRLTVSCTEKRFEDMDIVEKTSAIIGDAFCENIQVTD